MKRFRWNNQAVAFAVYISQRAYGCECVLKGQHMHKRDQHTVFTQKDEPPAMFVTNNKVAQSQCG